MANSSAAFTTILESVNTLSPVELAILQERIASSRQNQLSPPKKASSRNVFDIAYGEYLTFSEDEREALQWEVFYQYQAIYEKELSSRRAQWMIVCGGKIVAFSKNLDDFPSREQLDALGKTHGFIPFVFVPRPLIEESAWSTIDENDFYPTLLLNIADQTHAEVATNDNVVTIKADLDTGSPHLFVDYDRLFQENAVEFRTHAEAFIQQHLGKYYRFHILPVNVAIVDESGKYIFYRMHAYCVRDWQQSSLCLVNPHRQALAGRNVILKFQIKVELNGKKKTTRVSGIKSRKQKK